MNISDDEIIEKHGNKGGHCSQNTLMPYKFEFSCFSCGYNVIKRKHELSNTQNNNKFYQSIKIC